MSAARSRGGFALFLVVVILAAVSALLLHAGLRARVEYRHAFNAGGEVRARAAARAGLSHAVARLRTLLLHRDPRGDPATGLATDALRDPALRADLARVELSTGTVYRVEVRDVAARLNVNAASEEELRALFIAAGAGFREADVAAQSVLDWRDPDALHRARGAEWDDWYRHQPVPVRPRNGPLESTDELRAVRGMESLFARVAPLLTVAGDGKVNLNTAPAEVLRAVPGLDAEAVAVLLAQRRGPNPLRTPFALEARLSPPSRARLHLHIADFLARAAFDSDAVEITSRGTVRGVPFESTVRAIVGRTGSTVHVIRTFEE